MTAILTHILLASLTWSILLDLKEPNGPRRKVNLNCTSVNLLYLQLISVLVIDILIYAVLYDIYCTFKSIFSCLMFGWIRFSDYILQDILNYELFKAENDTEFRYMAYQALIKHLVIR